jgi:hypothetical protein
VNNLAMERKLDSGEAVDLGPYRCEGSPGMYQIPQDKWPAMAESELCDAEHEQWIWSVGRCVKTWRSTRDDGLTMLVPIGTILASTSSILYQHQNFKCLWLR